MIRAIALGLLLAACQPQPGAQLVVVNGDQQPVVIPYENFAKCAVAVDDLARQAKAQTAPAVKAFCILT